MRRIRSGETKVELFRLIGVSTILTSSMLQQARREKEPGSVPSCREARKRTRSDSKSDINPGGLERMCVNADERATRAH
jgi:hypothetical protein